MPKDLQKGSAGLRLAAPTSCCLWNSFVYVDVVPDVDRSKQKMSLFADHGSEEESVSGSRDEEGSQEEEGGDWVKL